MAQQPPSQPDGAVDLTLQDRRPSGRKPVHAFFPNDPDTAVIVPVADVHQLPLPPATADGNSAVADQPAGQQQPAPALLCESYAQAMRCDRGSACPFIHAVVENATRRTIHIRSDTWKSPSDVRYDMFDPGQPVKLSGPYHNFDETVDPGLCIRTAVEFTPVTVAASPATPENEEQEEGLLSATHCAHFLPKGVCHLGKVCKFVHMAFPSPGALQSVVRPPQPARAERNTTAPTPAAGPRKSPQRPARGGGGAGGGDQPAVAPAPPSSRRGKSSSRVASRNPPTAAMTSDSQPGGTTTASAVAGAAVPPPTFGGGSGVIPSKSSPQAASHPAPPPRRKQPPAVGGFIAHATHAGGTIPAVGLHQHPAAAGVPPMVALPVSPDAFHQQHPVPVVPLVPGPGALPGLPAVGAMQPSAFPIAQFQPHMVASLPAAAPGPGAPPMAHHHLPSGPNTGGGVAPFIVPQFVPAGALPPTAALPPGATFVVYPPPQQTTTSSLLAASAQADAPPTTTQHPGP